MLIDEFLPRYDVHEYHEIDIAAPAERIYAAMRTLDLSRSWLIRMLFGLRGLPALFSSPSEPKQRLGLTLAGLLDSGFILLGETPQQELVLGLVGKFWTASGEIQHIRTEHFRSFDTPGFAKAVWNFSLAPQPNGVTNVSTNTRVLCLDEASRRRFRMYWLFIRPFSGAIRLAALRAIKRATLRHEIAQRLQN
ncbi:hypothetical protein FBQ85_13125 [Cytophagia bacterium CHB2]|nr:hypothetical protein [Cytophagia bacterium CHB2]